jgi:ankyrin repeat protein
MSNVINTQLFIRSSDDYLQVAALIEAGANVNYQNLYSESPLIYAIEGKI